MRRAARVLTAVGSGLATASLALTVDNLHRAHTPPAVPPPVGERVAVLLPVRDEAGNVGPCLDALRAAADTATAASGPRGAEGDVRILVLDDGSTDATAGIVRAVAREDPRVRLLTGDRVPAGWLAKPWACHQLAEAARAWGASVLVFVDADVTLAPAGIAAGVAMLRDHGLDLVSPYPRQIAVGVAERLVQPLLQWSWFSTLPLALAERSPRSLLAAANGQFLVVDAPAYRAGGGHEAVRASVLDDIALVRAVKRAGGTGVVADGTTLASCRMYVGGRALREGYGKSLWAAFGSPAGATAVVAALALAYVVPPVAALAGSRTGLVGTGAAVLGRLLVARRTRASRIDALGHPLSVTALGALTVDSFVRHRAGTLRWRGRAVEVGGDEVGGDGVGGDARTRTAG